MQLFPKSWRRGLNNSLEPLRKARRDAAQARAGRLFVEVNARWLGFFAQMAWVLELLTHAEETGREIQIRLTALQYVTPSRGGDFLGYFFEPVAAPIALRDSLWHRVEHIDQLKLPRGYDSSLRIETARDLLFRHYRLRPEIAGEIDAISARLFHGAPSLGIHFRGTDKISEADRVEPLHMIRAIETELSQMPAGARLFVATDEQSFLDLCTQRFGRRVVALDDHLRSTDAKPVHKNLNADGYSLGRDALFNCLMLSRCTRVLKTASILSAWAKVFEPNLEIYTLSRRRGNDRKYFPERCIPDYVAPGLAAVA